jgi:predicted transcriptional regulator
VSGNRVRPPVARLTDEDARRELAKGLIRACADSGPSRIALEIGCDEKTVRRARDQESTLHLASVVNLEIHAPGSLRELFERIGKRIVDIDGEEKADLSLPCVVARFQLELSLALEDGKLDAAELRRMRPQIEALGEAIDSLRERLAPRVA